MGSIYHGSQKVKKIFYGTQPVKRIYHGTHLVWTSSETVSGISSAAYNITALTLPTVNNSTLSRLVDGNNELQCTWNPDNQYIDFNFTDCYVEPLSLTIWSGKDNNARNGVYINSVVGITPSGGTVTLWSNKSISTNNSIVLTRTATDREFKTVRFYISKNGSVNLTLGEIYFNTFVKYPI